MVAILFLVSTRFGDSGERAEKDGNGGADDRAPRYESSLGTFIELAPGA